MRSSLFLCAALSFALAICAAEPVSTSGCPVLGSSTTRQTPRLKVYVWSFHSNANHDPELLENISDEFQTVVFRSRCFEMLQRQKLARLLKQRDTEGKLIRTLNAVEHSDIERLKASGAQAVFFGDVLNDASSGHVRITVSLESFDTTILSQESVRMRPPELVDAEKRQTHLEALVAQITGKRQASTPSASGASAEVRTALSPSSLIDTRRSSPSQKIKHLVFGSDRFVLRYRPDLWSVTSDASSDRIDLALADSNLSAALSHENVQATFDRMREKSINDLGGDAEVRVEESSRIVKPSMVFHRLLLSKDKDTQRFLYYFWTGDAGTMRAVVWGPSNDPGWSAGLAEGLLQQISRR